jgi:plastocyanin
LLVTVDSYLVWSHCCIGGDPSGSWEKEVAHDEVVSMRRILCLVAFSFLALLVFVPVAQAHPQHHQDMVMGQPTTPKEWSVAIEDFYFEPANAAVNPGDTVTWVNEGNHPHTVTADDGQFDSEVLNPGDSFSVTFPEAGTVGYHCEIHPSMTGSVTVGPGGGGGGGGGASAPMEQQPAAPAGGGMGGY